MYLPIFMREAFFKENTNNNYKFLILINNIL